ncbi:MAG TPA: Ig-like domain-containing protein, partial [Gemmatimonadales bacterium]
MTSVPVPPFSVRGLIRLALPVGSILLLATCREEAPFAADRRAPRQDLAAAAGPDILVGAGNIARCDKQNDEATAAILDTVAGTVFTAGDNVYSSGSSTEYTTCYGPSWGRHRPRTRPSAGDKDYKTTGAAGYFTYFGSAAGDPARGYYSYDLTDWHVVVLNSGTSAISTKAGSLQEQWLRADLAATAKQCILGVWHTPLFSSSGTAVKSSIKPLWDALYAAHADVVVNGHYRVYERFTPQSPTETADPAGGIREFIVGTGGQGSDAFSTTIRPNSEVRSSGTFGVLKLVLGAGTYSWQFIPVAGGSFSDAGSGTCHNRILAPVASVTVTPASASVLVGLSVQLTATPRDASGNALSGRTVTWASAAPGVATVDAAGLVTATAEGSATITATSEGQSGTATIAVATVPVASVDVSPASASVQVADALRLTAIPRDAAGNPLTGRVVTWSTTDATIAPVDATGLVTGARAGAATVTATVEGLSAAASVTVTALPPCLSRTGPGVVLSGVQTAPYNNTGLAAGTKIDARAAQFLTGVGKGVVLGGGAAICLSGGAVIGQLPPSTDWNTMHDTYATT